MTVLAIADMFGISGRRDELRAVLASEEAHASAAPGCVRYRFAAVLEEPDRYLLVSEWQNRASLDAHYASPGFVGFQLALDGLLARPSEMTIHTVTEALRPVASGPMDPRDAD